MVLRTILCLCSWHCGEYIHISVNEKESSKIFTAVEGFSHTYLCHNVFIFQQPKQSVFSRPSKHFSTCFSRFDKIFNQCNIFKR